MTEIQNDSLFSYEEDERLTVSIEEIMAEKTSDLKKLKRLKSLENTVYSQISRCHIEYYLKKLREAERRRIQGFICMVIVAAYFVFMLCRVFWYFNPGYNPFSSSKSITTTDLIVFIYLIPIAIIVYRLINRFLYQSLLKNAKRFL